MRNIRRKLVNSDRKMRHLVFFTFGVLLFIYLTVNLIIGENGLLKFIELSSTRNRLYAETIALEKQNEDIRAHIEELKNDPDAVEEFAREYGLTKKGELIFKFDDQK